MKKKKKKSFRRGERHPFANVNSTISLYVTWPPKSLSNSSFLNDKFSKRRPDNNNLLQ